MKYENLLRIRRVGRRDVNCLTVSVCLCVCVFVCLCLCVFAFLLGSFLMQPQKLIGLWIVICDRQQGQSGTWGEGEMQRWNIECERESMPASPSSKILMSLFI